MVNQTIVFLLEGLKNKYNSVSFMHKGGLLVKARVLNFLINIEKRN